MLSPSTTEGGCSCGKKSLNNNNNGGFSSSSSSSSSSSNSSSITPSFSRLQQTPRNNKSMEDVWKDINLASLTDHSTCTHNHHHHPVTTPTTSNLQSVNFHDFLTPPLTFTIAIDPPPTTAVSSKTIASTSTSASSSSLHSPPVAVAALSLNSLPQMFHFDPLARHNHHHHPAASKVDPLSSNPLQNSLSSSLGNIQSDIGNSRDRRNKRMMKNRESAARSRARKQAYTYELKQKVKHLEEENARLRRQQQQLCDTAANKQQKKRGNLYRTSTAPF